MGLGSSFKKIGKAFSKPFKSAAKRIKRTASKVWKGVKTGLLKPIGEVYSKTFGKLGPLGMVAAGFVLPGLGSLISAGWGSIASSLAGTQAGSFLHAVGTGMQSLSTGISGTFSGISDKIGQTFSKIGTDISTGANNLFTRASEWTAKNLPTTHENISKMGDWMSKPFAEGPTLNTQVTPGSLTKGPFVGAPSEFTLGEPTRSVLGAPEIKGEFLGDVKLGLDTSKVNMLGDASGFSLPEAPTGTLVKPRIMASGEIDFSNPMNTGGSIAKNALKAGASLLSSQAVLPDLAQPVTQLPDIADNFGSLRAGIGGTGAVGGQFLTPQMQAFFQRQASILGQQG